MHNWREVIGEVGVIVIGVLIALGFEQLIEMSHWRHKVEQANEALHGELRNMAQDAVELQVAAPCIQRQLSDLQARMNAPGKFKPAPLYTDPSDIAYTVRVPSRLWSDGVWQVVTTEGVSTHLPSEQRAEMQTMYASTAYMRQNTSAADALVWRLATLAQPIGEDPAGRARLSEEISELQGRFSLMTLIAGQILRHIDGAKMMPKPDLLREAIDKSGTVSFCRSHGLPLGRIRLDPA